MPPHFFFCLRSSTMPNGKKTCPSFINKKGSHVSQCWRRGIRNARKKQRVFLFFFFFRNMYRRQRNHSLFQLPSHVSYSSFRLSMLTQAGKLQCEYNLCAHRSGVLKTRCKTLALPQSREGLDLNQQTLSYTFCLLFLGRYYNYNVLNWICFQFEKKIKLHIKLVRNER